HRCRGKRDFVRSVPVNAQQTRKVAFIICAPQQESTSRAARTVKSTLTEDKASLEGRVGMPVRAGPVLTFGEHNE
ncbi:MAG: hypothetical protein ABW173_04780, partial [Sphingomonas sp.]